jgi:hypothetical protein
MSTPQAPPSTLATPLPLPEQAPVCVTADPVPSAPFTTQLTFGFPRSGVQDAQLEVLFRRASDYLRTLGPPV